MSRAAASRQRFSIYAVAVIVAIAAGVAVQRVSTAVSLLAVVCVATVVHEALGASRRGRIEQASELNRDVLDSHGVQPPSR